MSATKRPRVASVQGLNEKKKRRNQPTAGGNTAPLSEDGCGKLLDFYQESTNEIIVQVLAAYRYVASSKFEESTGIDPLEKNNLSSVFDVIISDGRHKAKMLLAPEYGTQVLLGNISPLTLLKVHKWTLHANELVEETVDHIPILIQVEILSTPEEDCVVLSDSLKWHPKCTELSTLPKPLDPGGELYLPLTCSTSLTEFNQVQLMGLSDKASEVASTVFENSSQFWEKSLKIAKNGPEGFEGREHPTMQQVLSLNGNKPIIGRVTSKSAMQFFGSTKHKTRFPVKFEFTLSDNESDINVAVWNRKCLEYFCALCLGDIVMVSGHRLKSYMGHLELSINSGSSITKITHAQHKTLEHHGLESVRPNIDAMSMARLTYLIHHSLVRQDQTCNMLARVQYAGPREFTTAKCELGDKENCFGDLCTLSEHRMLVIADHSSEMEVCVKIHPNSQFSEYTKVTAGDLIFLSALAVSFSFSTSDASPTILLAMTHKSHMFNGFPPATVFHYSAEDQAHRLRLSNWRASANAVQPVVTRAAESEAIRSVPRPSLQRPRCRMTLLQTPWKGTLVPVRSIAEVLSRMRTGQAHYCRVQGYVVQCRTDREVVEVARRMTPQPQLLLPVLKIQIMDINKRVQVGACIKRDPIRAPVAEMSSIGQLLRLFPNVSATDVQEDLRRNDRTMQKFVSKLTDRLLVKERFVFCLELRKRFMHAPTEVVVRAIMEPAKAVQNAIID